MASFLDELNLCSDLSTLGEKVNYIMSGSDDNSTVIDDDWQHLNHGARTSFLNALNEDFGSKSFSEFLAENENVGHPWKSENQTLGASIKMEEGEAGVNSFTDVSLQPNHFSAFTSPGGLAERMAAKKGFSLPKIDTARISPNSMVSSTDIQSPYFTIPPGLSPTLLLESPVFLSDSLGQLSPTRGKFHFSENVALNPLSVPYAKDEADLFEEIPETFTFKPLPESHLHLLSSEKKQLQLPSIELPNLPEKPSEQAVNIAVANKNFQDPQDFNLQACSSLPSDRKEATINVMINPRVSESFVSNDNFPAINDQHDEEANPKGDPSAALGTPAEDGYNWRKYGQKQVKGSEFPRSYYKCTHPSCQVKKKVERSHEGHITEIIYKGNHNHPQPNMHRRPSLPSSHPVNDTQIDGSEQPESQTSYDGKPIKGSSQSGNGGQDWLGDGLEASSSAPAAVDYYNHSSSLQQNQDGTRLSPDIIRVSSTMSNNDEDDDQATLGSVSQGCDGEGDETESKKMKLDACAIDMSAASRAVREPRVVVQTTSEVDILDDGYRWRKYGQKVVKGNPNPRSYYKCTNPGCIVRKHIERASHDLKSVITTYEGKHNHDVPAARGGSHHQSVPCSTTSNSVTQPHNLLQRHEPAQDALVRFDGHSSLSTFSFPGRDQLGTKASFPYAMAPPGFPSLSMVGLAPMAPTKMPILPPIHPYVSHLQPTEAGFMMPKMEHKEGAATELMPPVPNAASLYHQMMSRLPLGPQL